MIELLCTLTGIIAGVVVVASLMQKQEQRKQFAASTEQDDTGPDRIQGIAAQLQVISHRVAADVVAHNQKVVHISDKLSLPTEQPAAILSTINEIITANKEMEGQLANAQKRIAQQTRMIEQASQQARTDALTGLANRRALNEFISNCLENMGANELVGLLLMDIDHFKKFNDNFGHTTGDAVLASFARSLSVCCGENYYAARYGGEEFAVIITANSIEELVRDATEIRYFVSQQIINFEDLQLQITSSGGLSLLLPGDTSNSVYERADEGLYHSKKAGRNCGHWLSESGWQPFPTRTGEPRLLSELMEESLEKREEGETKVASGQSRAAADGHSRALPPKAPVALEPTKAASPPISDEKPKTPAAKSSSAVDNQEILDLNTFLLRLESYVSQLRKAELPATAFMIEALGLKELNSQDAADCWSKTVEMVQQGLRGIDVVCLYRPFTLSVFMPSCSLDAGIDRASRIKSLLTEWSTGSLPEKYAVAVAGTRNTEDNPTFLNRLELALEEAIDTKERELAVHDGDTCHFHEF